MNDLQALTTGALIGALMKAREVGLDVTVIPEFDDDGNYLPSFVVHGNGSGDRLRVLVETVEVPL